VRVIVPRITCALALVLAACRESSGPRQVTQFSYAIFNADIAAAQTGELSTSPVGYFFRAPALDLPSSEGTLDVCQLQRLVGGGSNLPPFISAGDSIAFAPSGGSTVYLKPQTDTGVTSYYVPNRPPVAVTSGASVTFTVPGATNGFPASSITVRTVEPYQMSTVPADIAEGQALTLTWDPAGDTDSRIDIAFLYATTPGGPLAEQLYCSLVDDGGFVVPAANLNGFRAAAGSARQFASRRWRTSFKDLGGSFMLAISSYSAPLQRFP
jgi:hypothetical protein